MPPYGYIYDVKVVHIYIFILYGNSLYLLDDSRSEAPSDVDMDMYANVIKNTLWFKSYENYN